MAPGKCEECRAEDGRVALSPRRVFQEGCEPREHMLSPGKTRPAIRGRCNVSSFFRAASAAV